MGRYFMLVVCMNILYSLSFGQTGYMVKGTVADEKKHALPGASVIIYPEKTGTTTDQQGRFVLKNLQKGTHKIEISFIGYITLTDTLSIPVSTSYDVVLKVASLSLQEVEVTDHYAETRKKEESLNVEIVNDDYLKQNLGGSLMKSLERLPGVSTIDIGAGQSKPVIRGLGFNRVVVVENSIKHEAQQWGDDHGLEIDQYAIGNIEVIKGPASLMYGSDAIGGVIDMKKTNAPAGNIIGGTFDLSGKSNNGFLGTSLSLYGRKEWFFAEIRATLIDYGDYKVPVDSVNIYSYRAALYKNHLRNTAGKEQNLHVSFGVIEKNLQSKFYISFVSSKNGFFANAHGLEPRNVDTGLHDKSDRDIQYPYQSVNHFKAINTSQYTWKKVMIESDLGFQRNLRNEFSQYVNHGYMPSLFPDTLDFSSDLERQFDKYVYTGNLKITGHPNDQTTVISGLNSDYQDNRIDGRGFIIPAFTSFNFGGFLFLKNKLSEKSLIQAGIRYDYGKLKMDEYYDWFLSPVIIESDTILQYLKRSDQIQRKFSSLSWSVGYNLNLSQWSLKANIGKSFRMPLAKELEANGVNYHHFSYEVGNPDLSPEVSYQLDLGMEFTSKRFAIGVTPFLNYFTNYIYLNPSSEHDRLYGNGNQVFYYTQSKVIRYGAEVHAHYELMKSLQLGIIGEHVFSRQLSGEKKGYTLPFSPPPSLILNIKYQSQEKFFAENTYLSIDYRLTAPQNNIVPPEETTAGYQVINLSLGGDVKLKTQTVNLSLQVQNLFNAKYFNHTSYYRLLNVPEPGRNLIINITIPVSSGQ